MSHPHVPSLRALYEQNAPVGELGRGTHYSVYRGVISPASRQATDSHAVFHDVAVIWDEDHDTRVLVVLEAIYLQNLLWPILFIGERKGVLSVIVSPHAREHLDADDYNTRLTDCARVAHDVWTVDVASYDTMASHIIDANENAVRTYLACIHLLWSLGSKPTAPFIEQLLSAV